MSNYLIDTHALIWKEQCSLRKKLSKKVIKIFERVDEGKDSIFVPSVVIWELGALYRTSKLKFKDNLLFRHWIENRILNHSNINFVASDLEDLILATGLNINSDPFDNLLVATASRLNMPLISKDRAITESQTCKVIW